jgi:hypothetical protein
MVNPLNFPIEIKGKAQVIKKLISVVKAVDGNSQKVLSNASKVLRNGAILNLENRVGTARWPSWGTSADGSSIRDISNWIVNPISKDTIQLVCKSSHAAVVEFGGAKTGTVLIESDKPYPIGKQQGANPLFRPRFAIQPGYHYLTSAMNSKIVQEDMLNSVSNTLRSTIRAVAGVSI